LWYPKWEKEQTEATISWDVAGYYLYLPAAIIYKDLAHLEFKDSIFQKYNPSPSFYHAIKQENGNYIMKYSIGLSCLYLPFFVVTHLIAGFIEYPADGFSFPYQLGYSLASLLVAFLGLWISRKTLLKFFNDKTVAFTLVTLVFATNYLNYTAIDGAMTHNWLFTLYALLIAATIRWYKKPDYTYSVIIGVIACLCTLGSPS